MAYGLSPPCVRPKAFKTKTIKDVIDYINIVYSILKEVVHNNILFSGIRQGMLSKVRGFLLYTEEGQPWPQSSSKRIWLSLMQDAYCVEELEVTKETKHKNDIIKQLKPTLATHYFRHNYAMLLFEAGVDLLNAMKILGHTDYQTMANIYTHLKSEMMKNTSVDMEDVFGRKQEAKSALAKAQTTRDKRSRNPVLNMSLPWEGKF